MKTFKSFISEGSNKQEIFDKQEFIDVVKKDCSEFISLNSANNLLYRGMRTRKDFLRIETRTDREPTDISAEHHKKLNDLFTDQFGFPYRSASVFVIGSSKTAANYGQPFAIFPTNGYTIAASNLVDDLYTLIGQFAMWKTTVVRERIDLETADEYEEYNGLIRNRKAFTPDQLYRMEEIDETVFERLKYFETKRVSDFKYVEMMVDTKSYYAMAVPTNGTDWHSEDIINKIFDK